jgi:hypothetical protein
MLVNQKKRREKIIFTEKQEIAPSNFTYASHNILMEELQGWNAFGILLHNFYKT